MNFIRFQQELKNIPIFSIKDLNKLSEKIYYHRLAEWQRKGLIERIANGIYKFSEITLDEIKLFFLANKIYSPSYISLESALSYYNFIPETVYSITSVTTKKTTSFYTKYGSFSYRKIKSSLFFGYSLLTNGNFTAKIAEPEKALLDYLYFHPETSNADKINELRLNHFQINETLDKEKYKKYLYLFNNKNLIRRSNLLLKFLEDAYT